VVPGVAGENPFITAKNIYINPLWFNPIIGAPGEGAFGAGDVAVIELSQDLPVGTKIYQLFSGDPTDPANQRATHIGYGTTGNGTGTSETFTRADNLSRGRIGDNENEMFLSDVFGAPYLPGSQIVYDFDANGGTFTLASPKIITTASGGVDVGTTVDTDALTAWSGFFYSLVGGPLNGGVIFGYDGLESTSGLGLDEVLIDGGDSGGTSRITIGGIDYVVGVHSFGVSISGVFCDRILDPNPANPFDTGFKSGTSGPRWNPEIVNGPDINCALDSTFGEFAGDTSVAFYRSWIMSAMAGGQIAVSEPATLALFGLGAGLLLGARRRRG
jgi:hypothetical protein